MKRSLKVDMTLNIVITIRIGIRTEGVIIIQGIISIYQDKMKMFVGVIIHEMRIHIKKKIMMIQENKMDMVMRRVIIE